MSASYMTQRAVLGMQASRARVYNLQVKQHQPVVRRRLVWRPLNAVQRWLEGEDKLPAKVVAYGVLLITAVFLVAQVVRAYG